MIVPLLVRAWTRTDAGGRSRARSTGRSGRNRFCSRIAMYSSVVAKNFSSSARRSTRRRSSVCPIQVPQMLTEHAHPSHAPRRLLLNAGDSPRTCRGDRAGHVCAVLPRRGTLNKSCVAYCMVGTHHQRKERRIFGGNRRRRCGGTPGSTVVMSRPIDSARSSATRQPFIRPAKGGPRRADDPAEICVFDTRVAADEDEELRRACSSRAVAERKQPGQPPVIAASGVRTGTMSFARASSSV